MRRVIRANHRVVITPDGTKSFGFYRRYLDRNAEDYHETMMERCEEIRAQILRHVDHLSRGADGRVQPGAVRIEYDTRAECSFCGRKWEELYEHEYEDRRDTGQLEPGEGPGMPLCCDRARDQWLDTQAKLCNYIVHYGNLETPDECCDEYAEYGEEQCAIHRERVARMEQLAEQTMTEES